ncbi:MAG TPA: hypothetical protein PKI20_20795 [Verrucomicrobiota bacterium]|jgi:hypothetical protein|nr:hypothetical protein [Verrucomicrobiota bacterium]
MPADVAQLTVDQNQRIEACKKRFTDAATAFAALYHTEQPDQTRLKQAALLKLHQDAKSYISCVEDCIVEGCVAGAFDHPSWLDDRTQSSEMVLNRMPELFAYFREKRAKLQLSPNAFEPSGNIFQNMQGIMALRRPERAQQLRQQFANARLPSEGFDKPLKAKPMKPHKNNPWTTGSFYLVACLMIVLGVIAICKFVPPMAIAPAFVALILLVLVVGALQLKNDDKLSDKTFRELMTLAMKRLFLFKK